MNIEVSVITLGIQNKYFDPNSLLDFYGVVKENLKPLILSDYRRKYKKIIDYLEPKFKEMNV